MLYEIFYWSIPMVWTQSFSHGDWNITLSTTNCCSNVSIDRTESINLAIIFYLIHLAAWSVLPSFIKHIYYLPTGGNIVGVCSFNILEDVVAIICEWWLGVEMVGMLKFSSFAVSQDCMSPLFVMIAKLCTVFWE